MLGREGVQKVSDKEGDGGDGEDLVKEQRPGEEPPRQVRPREQKEPETRKPRAMAATTMALAF